MRLIKFRGKTTDGRWLFGDLTHSASDILIHSEGSTVGVPVVEKTVGQFTGIVDSKRIQIFEGDVLEHENERWLVCFKSGAFLLVRISSVSPFEGVKPITEMPPYQSWYVIGNIFDNEEFISTFDALCKKECERVRNKERRNKIRRHIFS